MTKKRLGAALLLLGFLGGSSRAEDLVIGMSAAFKGPSKGLGIELYRGAPIFYSLGNFYFQAETIRQIPQEIYRNCEIASLSPSDFFKKVMGRMFEQDVFWEAIVPRMSFQDGRLLELTLYPVDLARQRPPTERGTPALARGARATEILQRQAELATTFGTEIQIAEGLGKVRLP